MHYVRHRRDSLRYAFGFDPGERNPEAAAICRRKNTFLVTAEESSEMCIDFLLAVIERMHAGATTRVGSRECGIGVIDVEIHVHDAFTVAGEKCGNGRVVFPSRQRSTQLDSGVPRDGNTDSERLSSPVSVAELGAKRVRIKALCSLEIPDRDNDPVYSPYAHTSSAY